MVHYTVTAKIIERDARGYPTGGIAYSLTSNTGKAYEVHTPHGGHDWQVAILAKRADGGRAWRWFKGVEKGIARALVDAVQAHQEKVQQETAKAIAQMIVVTPSSMFADQKNADQVLACFLTCAVRMGRDAAQTMRTGSVWAPAMACYRASGLSMDDQDIRQCFVQGFIDQIENDHPRGVRVTNSGWIACRDDTGLGRVIIGVGLIA